MNNKSNPNFIPRKCDICFQDVDASYKGYVMHILENHNPVAAKNFIPDPYILQSVLTGRITQKKCDICKMELTIDVYDYITHLQQYHFNMINGSLGKYVPDKYVVSICLNKNVFSQSSNIIICNECGEELDLADFNKHRQEHKKIKQLYKGFYKPFENPYQQNQYEKHVPFKGPQNEIKKSARDPSIDESNFCLIENNSQAKNFKRIEHPQSQNYNSNKNNSRNESGFSKENLLNNFPELNNFLKFFPNPTINLNLNINNHDNSQKTNIINYSVNNKKIVNNYTQNSEEIKELKNQIQDLTSKLENIQIQQAKTIEEHDSLQKEIENKINDHTIQMEEIEEKVLKLSNLETLIHENIKKIETLEVSKEKFDEILSQHEDRIDKVEYELKKQIKDLEKQYNFLNANLNENIAEKFNEIEKQLIKTNLKLSRISQSGIDFSTPSTWVNHNDKNENLKLILVVKNSNEFKNLNDAFLETMKNHIILKIHRIQNLELWKNFCFAKDQLKKKGTLKSLTLFHGTSNTDPKEIYSGKEEGFDLRFSNDGLFGRGIYFHQRAIYSHDYCFIKAGLHYMLIAEVLVGHFKELPISRNLRFPPLKDDINKIRYDSVKSDYDGIYIVYNNMRAYPSYLIEYTKN